MKAAVLYRTGRPEVLEIKDVPVPAVKRGHVLLALDYASARSWDVARRSGAWGEIPRGVLGADGSGTVADVGSDVRRLRNGDRVYAYSNPDGGFYAEVVSVSADRVERLPEQLDQTAAGAIPCVGLTAHSGLRVLKAKQGQTLLVYGASGGVGSLAVWLGAHAIGAAAIGSTRSDAHEYVRALGASHAIDPHSSQRDAVIKRVAPHGFDIALVTADGDDRRPFLGHLRPQAPFAYPDGVEPEPRIDSHPGYAFDGEMSHQAFERLNEAIGSRTIPLRIQVYSLDDVVEAHRRIEQGHVIGKIVLLIRG